MRITVIAAALCLSVVGLAAAADTDAAIRKTTNISPQGLVAALNQLAKERDLQVVYRTEVVGELQTPGAVGEFTAEEAFQQLLSGTGLVCRYIDERTITIVPIGSAPAQPIHSTSVTPLLQSTSEGGTAGGDGAWLSPDEHRPGKAEEPRKSFFDRFRLAQADQGKTTAGGPAEQSHVASDGNRGDIEEIVVTAQKRTERLIDTPQSVTVLSGDALAKLGVTQFRDFADTVPGLTFTTSGAGYTQIALRGVTVGADVGPTVGIYVDEVPYGSSTGFGGGSQLTLDAGLFDVDRIEVLRGPQGTLYGASTMGGLLKFVSKQADADRFGGQLRTGVSGTQDGSLNYNVGAAVDVPLVADKLVLRASGFESRDGGYIDNLTLDRKNVNRSDIYGGRFDLAFTPLDRLSIRVGGFLQDISRDGIPTADYSLAGVAVDDSMEQRRAFSEPFDQRFRLASATVAYDFGPATLTSISSYQTIRTSLRLDLSASFVPLLELFNLHYSAVGLAQTPQLNKFTEEMRLASKEGQSLEWLIGGFYTREKSVFRSDFVLRDPAGQPAPNILFMYRSPTTYRERAVFGDLTYHLSRKLDVSGGIRYAKNDQAFTQFGEGLLIGDRPTTPSSESVSTYLANARYHFGRSTIGYLRYATGYRPGGPNFVANDPVTGLPIGKDTFAADRLRSYEAGFKAQTANRAFSIDVAGYYIDWSDIQILTSLNGFSVYANAPGGAGIRGAELALTSHPADGFTMTGAFAYQDGYLLEDEPALAGARKGERLPNVPRFTAALNADYTLPVGWRPTIGATLRHVSERRTSFDADTDFQYRLPDYTTFDLRTGFTFRSVDLQFYVRNVSNSHGQLTSPIGGSPAGGPLEISILQPRTVGLSVDATF